MKRLHTLIIAVALGTTLTTATNVSAQGVVGLRNAYDSVFVAVRGLVAKGTIVTGIRFLSNDATVFPQAYIAFDGVKSIPPTPGDPLVTARQVAGQRGYTTIALRPFQMTETQFLWVVLEFPQEAMTRNGVGGGPGIGGREAPLLENERSLFSVNGSINEFFPSFDLSLITQQSTQKSITMNNPDPILFKVIGITLSGPGAKLQLSVPTEGHVTVTIYDTAGRLVVRLLDRHLSKGIHGLTWDGKNSRHTNIVKGVYFYRATLSGQAVTGKLAILK